MRTSLRSLPYSFSGVGSSGGKGTISSGLLDMSPTDAFTFTCFFYQHKPASSENQRIFGNATSGLTEPERAGIYINIAQNNQTILVGHNTGSLVFATNEAIIVGKWYFLAITQNANNDSSSIKVYFAPVGEELLEKSTNVSGTGWSTSYDYTTKTFWLGARGDSDLEWNGYIQDIQVHDQVLSLDAINDIYKQNKVLPSLVGRWAGPNAVSGSTIYEELGSGYDISVTGGASIAAASAFGARSSASGRHESLSDSYALSFDGSTSYTTFGSSVWNYEYTDPFSVSFWVNGDLTTSGELISKRLEATVWRGWAIYNQSSYEGRVTFRLSGTSVVNALVVVTQENSLKSGIWQHVVVTYDGTATPGGVNIYINGVSQTLSTLVNTYTGTMVSSANASIGCRNGTASNIIKGTLGPVYIYDRELSGAEAQSIYLTDIYPSDYQYAYLFDEQSGSTVGDLGVENADGTASNITWDNGPHTSRNAASSRTAA